MGCSDCSWIKTSVQDEINYIFSRKDSPSDDNFADYRSCHGRTWVFLNACGHAAQIAVRPIAYLVNAFYHLISLPFDSKKIEQNALLTLRSFANVIIAPLGQIVKLIQALFGLTHPGFYYLPPQLSLQPHSSKGPFDHATHLSHYAVTPPTPFEEISSFFEAENPDILDVVVDCFSRQSRPDDLERIHCFVHIFKHGVTAAIAPVAYLVKSVVLLFFVLPYQLYQSKDWDCLKHSGTALALALLKPVTETVKLIRGVGGVFYPAAYYGQQEAADAI